MDSENGTAGKVPLGHLVFTSSVLEWEGPSGQGDKLTPKITKETNDR